jgi:tRNA (cytidine/uridine-2'-O-)-methyltransferase
MRIALYQPDIPQNTGSLLRLGAALGVPVDIIEPCGFVWDDRRLRRSGMDYIDRVDLTRHSGWSAFRTARKPPVRLVLLTTQGAVRLPDFAFRSDDILLLGRESGGVPDPVHESVDARVRIPMRPGLRSLNVTHAAALALGEALRQTGQWPSDGDDAAG